MGVEYRGVLCVGYTYEEVSDLYEKCEDATGDYKYENIYEFCEGEGLTSYSPYYDADKASCIYGEEVESSDDYRYSECEKNIDGRVQEVCDRLEKEFFVKPKTYIMAHGW